jgi:hypothetical protein
MSLADEAIDAVDDLHRLDSPVEEREQRAVVALVRGIFPRGEAEIRGGARKGLARRLREIGENGNATDVVRGHHDGNLIARTATRLLGRAGMR